MIKVEASLEAESQRVKNYLSSESEEKLLRVLDDELLVKYEAELLDKENSGARVLLCNDMLEDLSRMYRLFSRVTNGLVPIADILRRHITDVGNEKIEYRISRANNAEKAEKSGDKADKEGGAEKESSDDPQFVKDLLAVHEKFMNIVNNQFGSNGIFQKALKDAFVEVVNRDAGKFKTAELLSSFCDRILKTGSTERLSDEEIENYLEKTVSLFSYLSDKDFFQDVYRNQLAKRLLNQRSASDEMEKLMISKLKLKCGAQFTAKMEGMLNDLSIGADHAKSFEEFLKKDFSGDSMAVISPKATGGVQGYSSNLPANKSAMGKLDFSVQVLTTGYWPTYKPCDCMLPPIMSACTQVFKVGAYSNCWIVQH
jgi:cullin 1